jgi:hypothetical protein
MDNSKTGNSKTKMTAGQIALLIATIYFVLGNIVGYAVCINLISTDNFLCYLFMPYTMTWGLSAMVGADWLTYVFIIIAFGVSYIISIPFGLYLSKKNVK